eukprot:Gb_01664 [translate_table: standard]
MIVDLVHGPSPRTPYKSWHAFHTDFSTCTDDDDEAQSVVYWSLSIIHSVSSVGLNLRNVSGLESLGFEVGFVLLIEIRCTRVAVIFDLSVKVPLKFGIAKVGLPTELTADEVIADMTCLAEPGTESEFGTYQAWEGEFFPGIPHIKYEGPSSKNPLAYKWYNAEEEIFGKKMKDWLRFSVAFWHTFRGNGGDPFGAPTKNWPWEDGTNSLAMALRRMKANFEFLTKLGVERWCFHDRDIAPDGKTLMDSNANLDAVVALAKHLQEGTSIRPLWGTAQLFLHPRYMHGAATSPDVHVYAYAAAQVKKLWRMALKTLLRKNGHGGSLTALVTHELGGENFVFWGGREGYQTLLNTDLKKELDHLASFLQAAVNWKKKIGFNGTLLIEPKPQEPTKHQYDWDAATTMGFLQRYGLAGEFKLNIECNHATLSGHSCHHELELARIYGMLGNIDANTGDAQTGWDTDQFLTDVGEATLIMLTVVKNVGLAPGGFNFDAKLSVLGVPCIVFSSRSCKLRRESVDVEDLFIAHISGMDTLARGLRNAAKLLQDGTLPELVAKRYESFNSKIGALIEEGKISFEELEQKATEWGEPPLTSGKQVNLYISTHELACCVSILGAI